MMPNLRGMLLLLLLVAASAVLALWIWDDLQRPPEALAVVGLDGAASAQLVNIAEAPKYDPPPIERFAAALDRPLFNPQRRPPEDEPTGIGVVQDRSLSATLQGILFASSGSVALLTAVGESSSVRVSEGDLFLGWKLLEIHPDKVVFGRDQETLTLELIYKTQPAPEPPKRRRSQ